MNMFNKIKKSIVQDNTTTQKNFSYKKGKVSLSLLESNRKLK